MAIYKILHYCFSMTTLRLFLMEDKGCKRKWNTVLLIVTFENHSYFQEIYHIESINQNFCYNFFMDLLFLAVFI